VVTSSPGLRVLKIFGELGDERNFVACKQNLDLRKFLRVWR
jgi:hypothetical protein